MLDLTKAMTNKLMTTKAAADYLGISMAFLERDRCYTARIPFVKIGSRTVRYRLEDLEAYLESRLRRSTSDQGPDYA